ncbi:MAG: DUF1592 domain-containing protein [Pirellulales bacterium]
MSIAVQRIITTFVCAVLLGCATEDLQAQSQSTEPRASSSIAENGSAEKSSDQKLDKHSSSIYANEADQRFEQIAKPFLKQHCVRCHNENERNSGIRVDGLDGQFEDSSIKLWEAIQKQMQTNVMPPEDEPQPSKKDREELLEWLAQNLHQARRREVQRNGSMRRLTVAQLQNTLQDLLGIQENVTKIMPPDAVSRDGFTNNASTLMLSPAHLETWFQIAERAVDLAIVDAQSPPTIQHFRMELGRAINAQPCPDKLILGANNLLLRNEDFVVAEPKLEKPFPFRAFEMKRQHRFIEGYQGNDTVRGWRDFDSIYHSVFACMRGSEGYPKGLPFELVKDGLLLRPAIPSSEIFGESNTYGPHSNFKISLRELPEDGNFRVKVRAAKYPDGILLDQNSPQLKIDSSQDSKSVVSLTSTEFSQLQSVQIDQPGIYQIEAHLQDSSYPEGPVDESTLEQSLVGRWSFDESLSPDKASANLSVSQHGRVGIVTSPFGKAISLDGYSNWLSISKSASMKVGSSSFTVAAWIHPKELRQAGLICLGGYGYKHGWIIDMPTNTGILRIETASKDSKHNGTVQTLPGIIKVNQWQHIAVVVNRSSQEAKLYVNGFEVASGKIGGADLYNSELDLQIGRVLDANLFAGEIDDLFVSEKALQHSEILALVRPGRAFATAPFPPGMNDFSLQLGSRIFTSALVQPAFLAVRLPASTMPVIAKTSTKTPLAEIRFRRINPESELGKLYQAFEKRSPELGVHVGLRRDCGSTMNPVGTPQRVESTEFKEYVFEGAIANFPSPDVEKNNVNYLAGLREIGVRSEYTDGRDMPRLLIQSVEFEGPYLDAWPPANHQKIFASNIDQSQVESYSIDVIDRFAERAFRRPLHQEEATKLHAIWSRSYHQSKDVQKSIRDTLIAVLTSPQFLFISETSHSPAAEDLDQFELASKLSYFLSNSPPDSRLLELAKAGLLRSHLDEEVDRLIADPRIRNFTTQFVTQWLGLEKIELVETDSKRFPKLTRDTKAELQKQPIHFFEQLVKQNLPVEHLIRSQISVVNDTVASYYGIGSQVEFGLRFSPTTSANSSSGGIISQAAILAGLSDGRESNPVKRGAWFARRIVAMPPDDPPPNVPKLEDLTHLTLRQRLERHRNIKGCVQCHLEIDPWGLPFEEFDAGGLRKKEKADSQSVLPGGQSVADFAEFQQYLITRMQDQIDYSLTKHLLVYAVGRSLTYNEDLQLRESVAAKAGQTSGLRDLIHQVIRSDSFLKK